MNKHVEEILKLSPKEQMNAYALIGSNLLNDSNFGPTEEMDKEIRRRIKMIDEGDLQFTTWDLLKKRIKNK